MIRMIPSALVMALALPLTGEVAANPLVKPDDQYSKNFRIQDCTFTSVGENTYFILKPGYQLVFEGIKNGQEATWTHTVLDKTETIDVPGIGKVEVRAVDEKEWVAGEIAETSTAFYAICKETSDVYDFGDDVYVHNADGTVSQEGSWRAGQPDKDGLAKAGIFMPGTFLVGARYFQQQADGYSVERGENLREGLTVETPAGTFKDVIEVFESNTLEEDFGATIKLHAPGVGLLGEGPLKLTKYGYNIQDVTIGPLTPKPVTLKRNITDDQAKKIALEAVPGKFAGIEIERKLGGKRLVVKVLSADNNGTETDVIIDMLDGKVLAIEK